MRSNGRRAPLAVKLAAVGALLFLHLPLAVVVLYAFTTDDSTFRFPLPGLTTAWFAVAWGRSDVWAALFLSVKVALVATLIAVVLGSLAAAAAPPLGRPRLATASVAGAVLAFALSFDEIIVTTFTAGQQETLPIWMFNQLTKPRQRPVTNVVALFVIAITTVPILLTHRITRDTIER